MSKQSSSFKSKLPIIIIAILLIVVGVLVFINYGDQIAKLLNKDNEPDNPIVEPPVHVHTEVILNSKEATCSETGLTEGKKCGSCGEILVPQTVTSKLEHKYGEWITVKEPTVDETGLKEKECSLCGHKVTEDIAKLENKPDEFEEFIYTYKDIKYTVLQLSKSAISDEKDLIIVKIKIENNSARDTNYNSQNWKMINSEGVEKTYNGQNTSPDILKSGVLAPGESITGTLAWEQVKGDENLRLRFYANLLKEEYTFEVKIK